MKYLIGIFGIVLSAQAFSWDYNIQNVKILNVESSHHSDTYTKLTLDLSDYTSDTFVTGCAPTNDAWVVTAWAVNTNVEQGVLSIAMMAMATDATVDLYMHPTVCDTNAAYTNLPVPGGTGSPAGGLGRRVQGLRLHLPE